MSDLRFELPLPDLAPWRAGNTGVEGVWRFDSGRPGRRVMISALVHGNEICGAWAVAGLLEALTQGRLAPHSGSLCLVLANLEAFDRFDARDHDASRFVDEDLNRQWQDVRMDEGGTRERRRAAALRPFVREADWLLDLHSMHEPSAPLLLTGLQPRNRELARRMGAPAHIVVDAGHKDGTRLRDYGRFSLPDAQAGDSRSLLVECGFHGDPASRDVARDQCLRFLEAAAIFGAAELATALPGWKQADAAEQWALEVTEPVVAKSSGFRFAAPYTGLECFAKAGSVIGDNDGQPVTTPYDDCVLVMPSVRQARAGVTVVRFAKRHALRP
ncbi:M14 family metallopeptidase [Comamonas composti]|uniref:succinylglutamate desuccinylase/aspartoacylase domain-containing protein n=1 Tax=Comamonas composti TaxID=408558 RepID=UPI00047B3FE5|nr:succinylglutamate desuccinylase/aspartoacylase family protein [Comamonas composti]